MAADIIRRTRVHPRIHSASNVPLGVMDCRVKPGNDDEARAAFCHFFTGAPGLSMGLGAWG
jgi:hypothetical protein